MRSYAEQKPKAKSFFPPWTSPAKLVRSHDNKRCYCPTGSSRIHLRQLARESRSKAAAGNETCVISESAMPVFPDY